MRTMTPEPATASSLSDTLIGALVGAAVGSFLGYLANYWAMHRESAEESEARRLRLMKALLHELTTIHAVDDLSEEPHAYDNTVFWTGQYFGTLDPLIDLVAGDPNDLEARFLSALVHLKDTAQSYNDTIVVTNIVASESPERNKGAYATALPRFRELEAAAQAVKPYLEIRR